jgi:HEAT repeat protein
MMSGDDPEKTALAAGTILKTDPNNKQALQTLTQLLQSSDVQRRVSALRAFRKAGPAAANAVALIAKSLEDPQPTVRVEAAEALGEVGPGARSAVPALAHALTISHPPHRSAFELIGSDGEVYHAAIEALGKIGPSASPAVPEMVSFLSDANKAYLDDEICKALAQMKGAAAVAVPALINKLPSGSPTPAIKTLAAIGPAASPALPELKRMLDSGSHHFFREDVYKAILVIEPDPQKRQQFAQRYAHDKELGNLALTTLAQSPQGNSSTLQILLDDFASKNIMDPRILETIKGLGNAGPAAAAALPKLIKDNTGSSYSEPVRTAAFTAIKRIDPSGEKSIPIIQPGLNDAFKVRASVQLLEYIGSPRCVDLAKATRDRWKLK